MNWSWLKTLLPILLPLLQEWLSRNQNPAAMQAGPPMADADADRLADDLERLVAQRRVAMAGAAPGTVGHEGGILTHVSELVAALRVRDWPRVATLFKDLVQHL